MNPATHAKIGEPEKSRIARPLCVDLDGTVLATDLLSESSMLLVARQPWRVFSVALWLMQGRAYMKRQIAERVTVNPATLPYREDVVRHLKEELAAGREIWLVTAADEKLAEPVARYLGIFSGLLASDGRVNVRGPQKLETIRQQFGNQSFDYIGDSAADLPVCAAATEVALVRPSTGLLSRARKTSRIERTFGERPSCLAGIWKSLRAHQWAKNALVLVPLLLAHKFNDLQRLRWGLVAFLSFCLVASAVYVMNDMLDLEADRQHPRKRNRPFAAGTLPLWIGVLLAPTLLIAGSALTVLLPSRDFAICLGVYLGLSLAYCFRVKRFVVLDVMLLAALYTLRVLAGGLAVDVLLTPWLLAFSMFLFLSLAFMKRYAELHTAPAGEAGMTHGRDYREADEELLRSMGAASGYLSVLVLALYLNSTEVVSLYHRPYYLWAVCALMLYWVTRMWFVAHRGQMKEDPLSFTLKDPGSYAVGVAIALAILAAI